MTNSTSDLRLLRVRDATRAQARRLQRLAKAGALTRVRAGVYVDADRYARLDERDRHVLRIRAVTPRLPADAMLSHLSALAVSGWPHIGPWPPIVHAVAPTLHTDLHHDGFTLHRGLLGEVGPPELVFDGVPLLPAAANAVDLARLIPFHEGVVVLDHVLRSGLATAEEFGVRLRSTRGRGTPMAARAVRFANGVRESVGESYTAARMSEIGVPDWQEQHEFRCGGGGVDRVDFWLPDLGIVIEFDGRVKYEDAAMLDGRSGRQVLWDEKRREDRIRARPEVRGFIRVTWWHLVDPDRLRALFREHGVPLGGRGRGHGHG